MGLAIADNANAATFMNKMPCYRREDRAMRPAYGCPEIFREFASTPTATFPEVLNGLLFRSTLWMCVALPVP